MKASLSQYRQSPRKVRLVADQIRGQRVERARELLAFGEKKSAPALLKLLDSALANARDQGQATDGLIVKTITVDSGVVMRRMRARARGRGAIIRHRTSRVTLELAPAAAPKKTAAKKPAAKKAAAKKAEAPADAATE